MQTSRVASRRVIPAVVVVVVVGDSVVASGRRIEACFSVGSFQISTDRNLNKNKKTHLFIKHTRVRPALGPHSRSLH